MKKARIFLFSIALLLLSCSAEKPDVYHAVHGGWVYNVKQHNDSIYFSTSEKGIFCFHPDHPEAVRRVAGCRRLPLRTMCFTKENKLLASSYYAGVFYASADTMLPLPWAQYPAWSMNLDVQENIWLACAAGVFLQRGEGMVRFCAVREAHDVAFFGNQVAVAHMRGISLYNRETGALVREYAKGLVCWSVTTYDSLLIGGGVERCLVIAKDACREIRFGPVGNILWATARSADGMLYLATQDGLFRARLSDTAAQAAAYKGVCIKSLCIDDKGRMWVGRFIKPARRWFF
jgi:ligand-binding sensor domain-containing protein